MSASIAGSLLAMAPAWLAVPAQDAAARQPSGGASGLTAAGLSWSSPSNLGAPHVALGDRGTTVLRLAVSSSEKLALLSSYDSDPPTPVWSIPSPPFALYSIAAAEEADVYLHSDYRQTGTFSNASSLRKYSSSSSIPDWTFGFESQGFLLFPTIDVSRDGSTIVGLIHDGDASAHVLHVFGPSSGIPVAQFSLPTPFFGNYALDLSSDGSTVAFETQSSGSASPRRTLVVELSTQSLLATLVGSLPIAGDALSDDGRRLVLHYADASASHVVVHERAAGGYVPILDLATPLGVYAKDPALSADGGVLAVAWWDSQGDKSRVRVGAFDLASGLQTMRHLLGGAGSLINYATEVSISDDGARFAVGCWGDGSTSTPELAVYGPDQDLPLFEFPLGGSVYHLDLTAAGQRLAVGRLPDGKHANTGYTNTVTELYDLGGQDLSMSGKPVLGSTVVVELHAQPGAEALLLAAPALAPLPVHLPGVGRLMLERDGLAVSSLGIVPASGLLAAPFSLPGDPGLAGTQLYLQVLSGPPAALTTDFVPITLLP